MKTKKFKRGDRVTPICSFDGPRTEVWLDENHKMPARDMDKIGKHATVISRYGNDYMILFDGEETECGWWHGDYLTKIVSPLPFFDEAVKWCECPFLFNRKFTPEEKNKILEKVRERAVGILKMKRSIVQSLVYDTIEEMGYTTSDM